MTGPATPQRTPRTSSPTNRDALKRHWVKVDHYLKLGTEDGVKMAELLLNRGPASGQATLAVLKPRPRVIDGSDTAERQFATVLGEARRRVAAELKPLEDIAYEAVFSNDEFR